MKSCTWYQQLKGNLYIDNYQGMRNHYQIYIENQLNIEQKVDKAALSLYPSVTLQADKDSDLADYSSHNQHSFYIPVNHSIEPINEIQYTLPFIQKVSASTKNLILKDFQLAVKKELAKNHEQFSWQGVLSKFLCSLDSIGKIVIYLQLLSKGTSCLQTYRLNFAPLMSFHLFLKHIIEACKHVCPESHLRESLLNPCEPYKDKICKICCVYGCVTHQTQFTEYQYQNINNQEDIIKSYLFMYKQFTCFQNEIVQQHNLCSNRCFKKLNHNTYYVLLGSYSQSSVDQNRLIEKARQIFLFQPCKISKFTKISCRQVFIYLMVHYPPSKIGDNLGLSQIYYLRQKIQANIQKNQNKRCKCYKIQSDEVSYQVNENNNTKICDQAYCTFAKSNKSITQIKRSKFVRIGKRNNNKLSLYTMNSLKKGQIIFWLSGEKLDCNLYMIRYILSRESYTPQCKYVHSSICTLKIGSKYRFLIHSNSLVGNIKLSRQIINNRVYWCFCAKQDIRQFSELLYPCSCKNFQIGPASPF